MKWLSRAHVSFLLNIRFPCPSAPYTWKLRLARSIPTTVMNRSLLRSLVGLLRYLS